MTDIVCTGPGPHIPASGILGQSDGATRSPDVRCPSVACQADIAAAQADLVQQTSNDTATSAALNAAMARLTQIKNQADALATQQTAWTVAQQQKVAQAMSDMALFERQLIRKALRLLDGSN